MISAGQAAPDFSLPRDGGDTVTLSALRPAKVVLYFYPADDTPGCTLESQDFTARAAEFQAANTTVIGISRDDVASHEKFCRKYGLNVILVSDVAGKTCEDYGVWLEKSNYGKTYMGIERTTVLIDGKGDVVRVWNKVKVQGHADEVLAAARAI